MSRRYGRNQKRRAREQIAALVEAEAMSRGLAKYVSLKNAELRSEIERAKRMLPEGSVLFGPGQMRVDGPAQESLRVDVIYPCHEALFSASASPFAKFNTHPLDVLLTDTVIDQMRDQLHFDVKFADDRWRYSITRQGLRSLSRRDLVATISAALARQITADLAAKGIAR